MLNNNLITVTEEYEGTRLDKYLTDINDNFSRTFIQKLVKDNNVLVNDKSAKVSYNILSGDKIQINIPDNITPDIVPQDIPIDIVYEDKDIIIINKPKGMVVHPAPGHYNGTLVNALMYHCKDDLSGINGVLRPGIVHRIDMNTTGLLVVCKNDTAHNKIAAQLKEHSITRRYEAIVIGVFKEDSGEINKKIGRNPKDRKKMAVNIENGRDAITNYRVIQRFSSHTHIECTLMTGRTHQIRVHMASIGHPILGDDIYGPEKQPFKLMGQTLHARTLGFVHPTTNEYIEFTSELPEYFKELIKKLS